ncbi:hypothetical protein A9P82_07430 [Arachidicoccus ginsenosidimutans]|uniref:MarR family winged helix-turn-helix transcriptional regulator n=1 Tax=Arachidicoccus sp. BS20 TaxID=1850526 RepID=UPI0007F11405|nr:MarR family transcriptional regulator [Arachidicoccus sp. BS20]ANI89136.1 hypothetical protein A9P82_07430 [Arachidicoccus sp. BS20]
MKSLIPDDYRSKYHRARVNILYSAIWINEYIRGFMEQFDLTPQQHNILRIIHRSDKPLNVLQIRDRMFEKLSDASRLIDRLELKGLVQKKKSVEDRRLVEITLTEKGNALTEKILEAIAELDSPMKELNEEEADVLSELLMKMRKENCKQIEQ